MNPAPQNAFPVVDSAAQGYRFVWQNRAMCMQLAGIPFLIKIGCIAATVLFGLESSHMRQGILLLPSYFAEGWMIGLLVRVVFEALTRQTEKPANIYAARNQDRVFVSLIGSEEKRLITASMIVYVLIQMIYVILISAMMDSISKQGEAGFLISGGSPAAFIFGVVMIAVMIWAVRLTWIYVPVAMGYSMKYYLHIVRPYMFSFYMLGVALLCSVPIGLAMTLLLQFASALSVFAGGTVFMILVSPALQAFAQIAAAMVGSAAMTFALFPLLKRPS